MPIESQCIVVRRPYLQHKRRQSAHTRFALAAREQLLAYTFLLKTR